MRIDLCSLQAERLIDRISALECHSWKTSKRSSNSLELEPRQLQGSLITKGKSRALSGRTRRKDRIGLVLGVTTSLWSQMSQICYFLLPFFPYPVGSWRLFIAQPVIGKHLLPCQTRPRTYFWSHRSGHWQDLLPDRGLRKGRIPGCSEKLQLPGRDRISGRAEKWDWSKRQIRNTAWHLFFCD